MEQNFGADVLRGLSSSPKHIPSRYFYDERGSRLFEEIMKLPEYYLTNCEWEIFRSHKEEFLDAVSGSAFQLVDLGAGDAQKTRVLLQHFLAKGAEFDYMPIDISREILDELDEKLSSEMPGLNVQGVVAEYFDALEWISRNRKERKMVLFMGSNIGNFDKPEAEKFLSRMRSVLNAGDLLLIGVDLKKDPRRILRAYDDSQGITAEFNYNLLTRMNRELGADFKIENWRHYATYDPVSGAAKSYLISRMAQKVSFEALDASFGFASFEPIHTEYSCKYSIPEIEEMAKNSGFTVEKHFYCSQELFVDSLWRV
jgi:dimethylhistidine N-methyltransferase